MSWKKDRDSLIAQTMAFVQSVTGRTDDAVRANPQAASSPVELAVLDTLETELVPSRRPAVPVTEPVQPAGPPPVPAASLVRAQGEMANEIRARVASFRAHQERFNREREEYFNQTIARLRDAAKDAPPPRINK